jgi:hypothetical protein
MPKMRPLPIVASPPETVAVVPVVRPEPIPQVVLKLWGVPLVAVAPMMSAAPIVRRSFRK